MPQNNDIPQKKGESKVMNVSLAEYKPVPTKESLDNKGWLHYGDKNDFPQYLIDLSMTSPIHGVLCKAIVRMIAGKGLTSSDASVQKRIDELKLSEVQKKAAKDYKIQGGFYLEVIYDLTYKNLARVVCLPFLGCRVAVDKTTGAVIGVYFSKNWKEINQERNAPRFIPLFNPENEVAKQPSQVLIRFGEVEGCDVYPKPDYWPGITYIIMSKDIPIYHLNNLSNGLFPSFMVSFMNGIPPEEKQMEIIREWEKNVAGPRNAGKFMLSFNESETTAPKVEQFPITDADKQYQYLLDSSTLHVFTVHSVTTPRLFGVMAPNGFSSTAEEMIEGLKIFKNEVIEPAQRFLAEGFETILQAEGLTGTIETIQNTTVEAATGVTSTPEAPQQLSLEKKKPELTESDSHYWIDKLKTSGEVIDEDEWELVSEAECTGEDEEGIQEDIMSITLASEASYANGDQKSKWGDAGLYKLRYAYSQNLSDTTRPFCREMVSIAASGKVYRWEDIQKMGDDGVNGSFAPAGKSTYDIFLWKGGAYCHHFWKRQIYFRKRKGGKFLPNDGLKNDIRVANVPFVKKKGKEGIAPIDTPTRGSLKNS